MLTLASENNMLKVYFNSQIALEVVTWELEMGNKRKNGHKRRRVFADMPHMYLPLHVQQEMAETNK